MSDLALPEQFFSFNTLLADCPQRDQRTERLMREQLQKLASLPSLTAVPTPAVTAASSATALSNDAGRHQRLRNMLSVRIRQAHRWRTIIYQAGILVPRLELIGDKLNARGVRQTMYMYETQLEDLEEDVATRTRLLLCLQGLHVDNEITEAHVQ